MVNSYFPPALLSPEFSSSFKDECSIKERDQGSWCLHLILGSSWTVLLHAFHAYWKVSSCRSCLTPASSLFWPQIFLGQMVLTVCLHQSAPQKRLWLFLAPYGGSQKCIVGLPQAPQLRHLTESLWFAVSFLVQGWVPDFSEVGHSNRTLPTSRAQLRRKR